MISLSLRTSNTEPPSPTPPSTPRPTSVGKVANFLVKIRRNVPAHCVVSSSGDAPQSHFGVEEGMECQKREPMEVTDTFICLGAVNVKLLLRASRGVLLETAEHIGGNVLVDERYVPRIRSLSLWLTRIPGGHARYANRRIAMERLKSRYVLAGFDNRSWIKSCFS